MLYVWWDGQIAPQNLGLGATIDLLIIAVIGGLGRIEGAWLGAFAFIVINNYVRDIQFPFATRRASSRGSAEASTPSSASSSC